MPLQETQTKVQKLVHTYCGPWIRVTDAQAQRPGSEQTLSAPADQERRRSRAPRATWMEQCGEKKGTYESVAVDASAVGWQLEEPPHDSLVPFLLLPRRGRHCSLSERLRVGHSTASPLPCRARGWPVMSRRRAPSGFRERRVDAGIGESRARGSREIFCSGSRRSGTVAEASEVPVRLTVCASAGSALVCAWFLPFRTGLALPLSLCVMGLA